MLDAGLEGGEGRLGKKSSGVMGEDLEQGEKELGETKGSALRRISRIICPH